MPELPERVRSLFVRLDEQLLVIDRFDLTGDGHRIGFEDVAALMGLRVRDTLSDRKYQRSYEEPG